MGISQIKAFCLTGNELSTYLTSSLAGCHCYTVERWPDRFVETWVCAHVCHVTMLSFPSALKRIPTFGNALSLPNGPVLHQLSERFPVSTTSVPSSSKAKSLNKKCSYFYDKDTLVILSERSCEITSNICNCMHLNIWVHGSTLQPTIKHHSEICDTVLCHIQMRNVIHIQNVS